MYEYKDHDILKKFMQEFFPFSEFKKIGFFAKEMKGNYVAQANRVCEWFGYASVFEYGAIEIKCHLSEVNPKPGSEFITTIGGIYD